MVFVLCLPSSMKLTVKKFAAKAVPYPKTRLKHFGNQVGGKPGVSLLPRNRDRPFVILILLLQDLPLAFESTPQRRNITRSDLLMPSSCDSNAWGTRSYHNRKTALWRQIDWFLLVQLTTVFIGWIAINGMKVIQRIAPQVLADVLND